MKLNPEFSQTSMRLRLEQINLDFFNNETSLGCFKAVHIKAPICTHYYVYEGLLVCQISVVQCIVDKAIGTSGCAVVITVAAKCRSHSHGSQHWTNTEWKTRTCPCSKTRFYSSVVTPIPVHGAGSTRGRGPGLVPPDSDLNPHCTAPGVWGSAVPPGPLLLFPGNYFGK